MRWCKPAVAVRHAGPAMLGTAGPAYDRRSPAGRGYHLIRARGPLAPAAEGA
jgi:hypothetical protein